MKHVQRLKQAAKPLVEGRRQASTLRALAAKQQEALDATSRVEMLEVEHFTGLHPRRNRALEKAAQLQLSLTYRELIAAGRPLPSFADAQLQFYSQSGEDGILQLILAATGTETRRTVEVCAGDGVECNSANLIVNHGWTGLLVDGGEELVTRGKRFYEDGAQTWYWPPVLKQAWVTRDNVNQLISDAGFAGEIDVLTIDLDGMDYWVWEALDCVRSRVVVVEYNSGLGPDEALTVPYSETFQWVKGTQFLGASLAAMIKLGERKGYRFVGTNLYGFNAFFVRADLAPESLPTADPRDSFFHAAPIYSTTRIHEVRHLGWVEV
jgi:hypothetical protein